MKINAWCKELLTIVPAVVLALGVAGCLSSDTPKLDAEDLTTPVGVVGSYYATKFPEDAGSGPTTIDAVVEAGADRSYTLTFLEGDHKDAPVIVRFVTLNDGNLLAVISDPDKGAAVYAVVTAASNGAWVFRMVDLAPDQHTRGLRDALTRHGATEVKFDDSDMRNDEIKGILTAANLRALFSDPDFVNGLSMRDGFRLSPKH
jgi:hypothetical protein